jgi:hypothetical protein
MSKKERIELTPLTPEDVGGRRRGARFVTLDSQGRLSLSAGLRDEWAIRGLPTQVYVSVNHAQKIIGVVKADLVTQVPNAALLNVDKRGYCRGQALFDKLGLDRTGAPYRFEYVGKIDSNAANWWAFRLVGE